MITNVITSYLVIERLKQTITSEIIHKYIFTQKRIRNEMNTAAKEDFEHASFINVLARIESIILMRVSVLHLPLRITNFTAIISNPSNMGRA